MKAPKVLTRYDTLPRGETHTGHVLVEREVREILEALKVPDVSKRALARQYGVSQKTVQNIQANKVWKHIPR